MEETMRAGGERVAEACMQGLLEAGGTAASVARIAQVDVERLSSALEMIVCGPEGCSTDGSWSDMLSEWFSVRAPLAHWGAAHCLEGLSGGAINGRSVLNAPRLGDALAPLTHEAAPLLASCLLSSPWRVCKLAVDYLAFRTASALRWHASRSLLARLLDDVAVALERGSKRHEQAMGRARARQARATAGEEENCDQLAAGTLGGWGAAAPSLAEEMYGGLLRCVRLHRSPGHPGMEEI